MANNVDDARHVPVFKLDGRKNKMDFIRGFLGVAHRFECTGLVYDLSPRPGTGDLRQELSGIG